MVAAGNWDFFQNLKAMSQLRLMGSLTPSLFQQATIMPARFKKTRPSSAGELVTWGSLEMGHTPVATPLLRFPESQMQSQSRQEGCIPAHSSWIAQYGAGGLTFTDKSETEPLRIRMFPFKFQA
jgi:hypothetical protein